MKKTFSDAEPFDVRKAIPLRGGVKNEAARSGSVRWLDRAIVLLMVAILLTLAWPVGLVFWSSHARAAARAPQEAGIQRPQKSHRNLSPPASAGFTEQAPHPESAIM